MIRNIRALTALATLLVLSTTAHATVVRFQTALGKFDVNLYDRRTPATVANFLAYVNNGAYTNVVVHRSVGGFVVQGGAYTFPGTLPLATISERPSVTNEPVFSNLRGTIAMAKVAGNPNSATSQWFINMGNNSANLDVQNGGFTVFGEIVSGGMTALDAINALQTFSISAGLDALPLRNYTAKNATDGVPITDQNLVFATSVLVLDSNVDSAIGLSPVANTLNSPTTPTTPTTATSGGGGGATGAVSLLLLGALALSRRLNPKSV